MRSDLENNKGIGIDVLSMRFGVLRKTLTADITISSADSALFFLDAGGSNRNVTLPTFRRGAIHAVLNIGSGNTITVKDQNAVTIKALNINEGAFFLCSGAEWRHLTATLGDSLDPTEITSPLATIDVDIIGGTAITIDVIASAIDHNSLLNFVSNKHIDHTAVTLTAGSGLSGGGDISASRTFNLDLNDLTADTPVLADSVAFYDASGADTNKATLTAVNAILDHDVLVNFVANKHIDHTTVNINAGTGLSGGGDISASRTITLAINGLAEDTPVAADLFLFYDAGGADHNLVTLTNLAVALGSTTGPASATDNAIARFDGTTGKLIQNSAVTIADTTGLISGARFALTGLSIEDTNASHLLTFSTGSNLTANRTLTFSPGDASREIFISADTTLAGGTHSGTNTGDETLTHTITFVIDGGGAAITTGVKGFLEIPFACTINRATTLGDQTGSIVIDIWKDTYANYPPTVADTITAAAKPTISSSNKAQDSTLTGWTTSIAAGDILGFNVDSITTLTRVTLSLKVTET